jgi:hypothetical protein
MKRILIGLVLISISFAFAYSQSDSIEIKKVLGTVYRQNGKKLKPGDLVYITKTNDEAYKEMRIAKKNFDVSSIFGFTGGFMIGWPIGESFAGKEPNWVLAGIGAGLIAIAIPFSNAYSRHAKNAVIIYNNGLKHTGMNKIYLRTGIIQNGLGFRLEF